MNFTDANVRRAFVALRALGWGSELERLTRAITSKESDERRALSDEEIEKLARGIANITDVITLDEGELE